jgi:hypothetical protein
LLRSLGACNRPRRPIPTASFDKSLEPIEPLVGARRINTGDEGVDPGGAFLHRRLIVKSRLRPHRGRHAVVLHEITHLIERNHGDAFVVFLDRHMPNWRTHRDQLNAAPLAHEEWNDTAAIDGL